MSIASPIRRVERIRHEVRHREVSVARVEAIGASFVGITFRGESLADFTSAGFDDHVKFGFIDSNGQLARRDYTPRSFDRESGELTIEFLVHGHGEGSDWARRAATGAPAVISGPKNSLVIAADYDWHLLIGDPAALPAISRRLEELPAHCEVLVIAEIDNPADRRRFETAAALDVHWVRSQDELMDKVRSISLPRGEGYCWGAGEGGLMAKLRDVVVGEKGHPREATRLSAYWRIGEAGVHETLEPGQAQPPA